MIEPTIGLPFIIIVVLVLLGIPIFASLSIGIILFTQWNEIVAPGLSGNVLFEGLNQVTLIAIPLFILTGDAFVESGLSTKLLDMARAFFGRFPSGFGTSVNVGSGLFSTISGSNAADAAAMGRISLDPLERAGYSRKYAAAMIASGSCAGILIPPSVSYIMTGIVLSIPVPDLFLASLIPGTLFLLSVIVTNVILDRRRGYEQIVPEKLSFKERVKSVWYGLDALLIPVILLGGIYSGVFTPSEAAAVAVASILAIGFLRREIGLGDLPSVFGRSALVNGTIGPIIAYALILAQVFSLLQIPDILLSTVESFATGYVMLVFLMFIIFLFVGAVMDAAPGILILGPLFLPIAQSFGMDPIHYAVFLNMSLAIGFITPPFGINLFVLSGVSGEETTDIARHAVTFMLGMVIVVLFTAFFEPLTMWLID